MNYKPHLLRFEEWRCGERWHCNDVSDLAHDSGAWWHACRALNISPKDFVLLLINEFKCPHISFHNGFLSYSWNNQADMRKFKNYINKKAGERKYLV